MYGQGGIMDPRAVVLKASLDTAHFVFNLVVGDMTQEMVTYRIPEGTVPPAMAILAHALLGEDMVIHQQVRGAELVLTEGGFAAATGIATPSPSMTPEWVATTFDLDGIRAYAAALFAKTDEFLAHATAEELDRMLTSPLGNEVTAAEMIAAFVVVHVAIHVGEVAALKGAQGILGMPF